jgi:hypothetical protein
MAHCLKGQMPTPRKQTAVPNVILVTRKETFYYFFFFSMSFQNNKQMAFKFVVAVSSIFDYYFYR